MNLVYRMLLPIVQYHRNFIIQYYIILHIISLESKIGRPSIGKDKTDVNKENIKSYQNKSNEKRNWHAKS